LRVLSMKTRRSLVSAHRRQIASEQAEPSAR
jgi:hypothetical protein